MTAGSKAFDDFFRAEYPRLVTLGTALTGDRDIARDMAQESLLRAYRSWPRVSAFDRPGAWCRRVLVNLAADRGRRVGREQRALARVDRGSTAPAPEFGESERFWKAVRALPARQRDVVALHYIDDLSVADIAELLGIAVGTVKAAMHSGRQSLARALSSWKDQA